MPKGRVYNQKERDTFLKVLNAHDGNVHKTLDILIKEGVNISYPTLRKIWIASGKSKDDTEKKLSRGIYPPMKKKEAVKLLEINNFDYKKTIRQINSEMDIHVTARTLRNWFNNYGKELCDDNRYRDALTNLTGKMVSRHEVYAGLVYDAKELILNRLIELIPQEKSIVKLANVFKVLLEIRLEDNKDNNRFSLVQMYNQYYINKSPKENTSK